MRIGPIGDTLPDLTQLHAAAALEGEHSVERLAREWLSGVNRFDRPGEMLLGAELGGGLVALGGLTRDPDTPDAFRMRRFYVLPHCRRQSIGRTLVHRLLAAAPLPTLLTTHAGTPAASCFWERLGFQPVSGRPHSHEVTRA